jgi:serine/threonine protein kinase
MEKQVLGQGSFGRVYKACDKESSRPVAIKRFYRRKEGTEEVEMLRCVREIRDEHGHKVRGLPSLLHSFQSGNKFFIVTELLGPTLGSLLRKPGQFPLSYVQSFGSQLCRVVKCKLWSRFWVPHTDFYRPSLEWDHSYGYKARQHLSQAVGVPAQSANFSSRLHRRGDFSCCSSLQIFR